MVFSDENQIVHRRALNEDCFLFEGTPVQHITIYNIPQYTYYLSRVSLLYEITWQQIIMGDVAMVTMGRPPLTGLGIVVFSEGFPIILQLWLVNINAYLHILWFA